MADAAARLHALTRHGSPVDRSQLVGFRPLDPANRPAPFKRYPDRPIVALPTDPGSPGEAAAAVLAGRVHRDPPTLDAGVLARLLFFSAGVTRVSQPRGGGEPTWFRAAMSAGTLHPVEVYVVCAGLGNVPPAEKEADYYRQMSPAIAAGLELSDVPPVRWSWFVRLVMPVTLGERSACQGDIRRSYAARSWI